MTIHVARDFKLVPIETLLPYERNARTHSPEQIAQLVASMREFGFTNPILIDGGKGIIAGHGRLAAAKKLGLKEVPVVQIGHLTDEQKRAYILADNKLALNAGWDDALLSSELAALEKDGFDLSIVGFTDDELKELLDDFDGSEAGSGEGSNADGVDDLYTKKIRAPLYEPKGEKPAIAELADQGKTAALLTEIDRSKLPEEIKGFLRLAATRHTVFSYEKIAEYYAHAPAEEQELFEASALVIIDFKKAIENGFVTLTKELAEAYPREGS